MRFDSAFSHCAYIPSDSLQCLHLLQFVARGIGHGFSNPLLTKFDMAKVVTLHGLSTFGHETRTEAIPLSFTPSPFYPGLVVSSARSNENESEKELNNQTLIVGTLRMGFGHHRIAYAIASWSINSGTPTLFHDLLSIDSPGNVREVWMISHDSCLTMKICGALAQVYDVPNNFFRGTAHQAHRRLVLKRFSPSFRAGGGHRANVGRHYFSKWRCKCPESGISACRGVFPQSDYLHFCFNGCLL